MRQQLVSQRCPRGRCYSIIAKHDRVNGLLVPAINKLNLYRSIAGLFEPTLVNAAVHIRTTGRDNSVCKQQPAHASRLASQLFAIIQCAIL